MQNAKEMNYRNWTVADLLDMVGSGVSHGPAVLLQSKGKKRGTTERGAHLGSVALQERGAGDNVGSTIAKASNHH